ncbi:MAG: type II secretion system minor pseudopilin GspJ [Dokdonella sp.]
MIALRQRGFTLVELLVAVAIFAAVAAIAYGGLAQVAQTRIALAAEQDRFAALNRAMNNIVRDLRQSVARPVRGNYGETIPALRGSSDSLELSRLGFANPLSEPRSHIERVVYALTDKKLRRGRYAVLDRAPGTVPDDRNLLDKVRRLRWRYLDKQGNWSDVWPSSTVAPPLIGTAPLPRELELPRAVELTLDLEDYGELRRVVALPATFPQVAPRPSAGLPPPPAGLPEPPRDAEGNPIGGMP